MDKNEMRKIYLAKYADTNNDDHGKYGKATEIVVKFLLNGNRGNSYKVSPKGKNDFIYKGISYEVKTGSGELNMETLLSNEYVVYNPRPQLIDMLESRVLPLKDFLDLAENVIKIRTEKTKTAGYRNSDLSNTTVALQTVYNKNSLKKYHEVCDYISKYPTIKEWKETH